MSNPEQNQLDITVSTSTGQSVLLSLCKDSTLYDLKQKINKQTKIPIDAQAIYLSKKMLFNQNSMLDELGINAQNSSIDLVLIESKAFSFNNLKKEVSQDCTTGPLCHRSIYSGLILHSVCSNSKCKVFGKQCCINKKMGKFVIGVQIHKCICPICGIKTKKAYKLSYFRCNIIIEGIKQDGEEFKYKGNAQGKKVKSFAHSESQMARWDHLQVITSEL